MIDFTGVTDIAIPEGNVTKITETYTGQVLWEKPTEFARSANWYVYDSPYASSKVFRCLTSPNYNRSWLECTFGLGNFAVIYLKMSSHKGGVDYYTIGGPNETNRVSMSSGFRDAPSKYSVINVKVSAQIATISDDCKVLGFDDSKICLIRNPHNYKIIWVDSIVNKTGYSFFISSKYRLLWNADKDGFFDSFLSNIVYSKTREEYLITGLKLVEDDNDKVILKLPSDFYCTFNSSTGGFKNNTEGICISKRLGRAIWCDGLGKYCGIPLLKSETTKGKYMTSSMVSTSSDGETWLDMYGVVGGSVSDICYCKGQIIAVGTGSYLGVSTDGNSFKYIRTPFSGALKIAYSPDEDIIAVLTNQGAYLTRDLQEWSECLLPNGESIEFQDFEHCRWGIFMAHEKDSNKMYFVSALAAHEE